MTYIGSSIHSLGKGHRVPGITGPSRLYAMGGGLEEGGGKRRRITVQKESALLPKKGGIDTDGPKITDFHYSDIMDEKEVIWTVTMPIFKVILSKATALLSPILSHIGLCIPPGCVETSVSTCGPRSWPWQDPGSCTVCPVHR